MIQFVTRNISCIRRYWWRRRLKNRNKMTFVKYSIHLVQTIPYFIIKSRRTFGTKEWYHFNLIYYYHRHINSNKKRSEVNHNALWSAGRSGNHWVRFIAEYLTGHPTQGVNYDYRDIPIYMNKFPGKHHPLTHVNRTSSHILYKSHFPYLLTNGSTVLLLLRDFREHYARREIKPKNLDSVINKQYISLIKAYDSFPGTKMIIYYEDLILNSEKEIFRIKHILGASNERYKAFMSCHDYYSELSRKGKRRRWSKSHSGTDIHFHKEKLDRNLLAEKLKNFYRLINEPENQLVKPYISRYI